MVGSKSMTLFPTSACFRPLQPALGAIAITQGVIAFDAAVRDHGNEFAGLGAVEAVYIGHVGDENLHLFDGEVQQIARFTPTVCAAIAPASKRAVAPSAPPMAELKDGSAGQSRAVSWIQFTGSENDKISAPDAIAMYWRPCTA
jgi:hypothetical protein